MPDEIVARFADEHFTLNSISERRRAYATTALARYEEHLSKPLLEGTDQDLRAWLVSLLNTDLKPSTVAWHLNMIKPFYRWAWRERLISADEFMRIREVSAPRGSSKTRPRPYSRKELTQMWAELDAAFPYREKSVKRWRNNTSHWRNVRKHAMRLQLDAIIELALVCGLRKNEIYCLSIDDCHWDNKYIVVHGKRVDQNDKVREVPYPDSTRAAVQAWFRMRGLMAPKPGLKLWLSVTGPVPTKELSDDRMNTILHSFGDWTLHRLRHTAATERLRAGMELEKLQRFLGHANLQQTLCYAQLVGGDVHKASERIDAEFQRAIKPRRKRRTKKKEDNDGA